MSRPAGLGSADALDRVRKRCVAAGWLHYEPGAKGVAGRYWVTVPDQCADLGDGPTDENQSDYEEVIPADTTAKMRTNPRSKCGTIREESAEHSSLSLTPSLFADVPPAAPTPERKAKKPAKEKKPRPCNPLFDALVEVTGSDPVVNGRYVGRVASLLASASPPYTPGEVHDFARDWRLLLPWAKPTEHPRLTLGIIEKHLPQLRAVKPLSRPSQQFSPPPDFDIQPMELTP
ncbi:Uncharacterized protein OS=Blastopirellula marina DSM 3645 GN=DSM3645_24505 PE=4 SV=1 [Gemmata massiliana]|uniref:Uncharacterized protein n=1 Tax=Gemmata massiliana TaxID=1210884 RepID=A0A6P2CY88_9BACT|nr:Uncharacterized protein OS=Blastopirellula marina DSM 3645 GN=DSM3645_24505 PE=4 SV=1 [Gemmata massiliana]